MKIKDKHIHIRIENELMTRIKSLCKRIYDTPISKFIRLAIVERCEKCEKELVNKEKHK